MGAVPTGAGRRAPTSSAPLQVGYKLYLNVLGAAVFAALFALTRWRGASDPVCGMQVDRAKAVRMTVAGETLYFCSEHCRRSYGHDDCDAAASHEH